jgi:coatomer subunit beta
VFSVSGASWNSAFSIANLRSGEDALANLSIEKEGDDGPITGFVRIRSRSQGLALSLGSLKGLNKVGGSV